MACNIKALFGVPATLHGFRSSLRQWCEAQGVPHKIAEMLLSHKPVHTAAGAYMGHPYVDERRAVLEGWARFVCADQAIPKQAKPRICLRSRSFGVNDLALTGDLPEAVLCRVVAYWDIAGTFHPMRDCATVLAILQPVGEAVGVSKDASDRNWSPHGLLLQPQRLQERGDDDEALAVELHALDAPIGDQLVELTVSDDALLVRDLTNRADGASGTVLRLPSGSFPRMKYNRGGKCMGADADARKLSPKIR